MSWARKMLGMAERKSATLGRHWLASGAGASEPPQSYEGQVRACWRNPVALRAVRQLTMTPAE